MKRTLNTGAAAVLMGLACTAPHAAVVISKDLSNPDTIPGLTSFATSGDQMSGLRVTATFATTGGTLTETAIWGTTGVGAGAAAGLSGWGLNLAGDTFSANWNFTFGSFVGQLTRLVLAGAPGLTVFDTELPNPGTPGSATGADFAVTLGCDTCDILADYAQAVAVSPLAVQGDTFHLLTLSFRDGQGFTQPRTNWSFRQDTDSDSRFAVPEPTSLALVTLALWGLGAAQRRRR